MNVAERVARALLEINAVGFSLQKPITFKSGIVSPVYVDNRTLPFWPSVWREIIEGFKVKIDNEKIICDVLAGIESAGIPHSAALGFFMEKPSIFVRKALKDHGTKKRVEGGDINGKTVLLIEDLVTTGGSSLSGVEALRFSGARVDNCLVIIQYGFKESAEAFKLAKVNLHSLTTFPIVLEEAFALKKITGAERTIIEDWFADPHGWASRNNMVL